MSEYPLDLAPLSRSLESLDLALRLWSAHRGPPEEQLLLRDGVIQRFEFAFELAWKTLKRFMQIYGLEQVDRLTNRELFRLGYEQALLDNPEDWMTYLRHRNLSSHLYDESVADQVVSSAEPFLASAGFLLATPKE